MVSPRFNQSWGLSSTFHRGSTRQRCLNRRAADGSKWGRLHGRSPTLNPVQRGSNRNAEGCCEEIRKWSKSILQLQYSLEFLYGKSPSVPVGHDQRHVGHCAHWPVCLPWHPTKCRAVDASHFKNVLSWVHRHWVLTGRSLSVQRNKSLLDKNY